MKKSPLLYFLVIFLWIGLIAATLTPLLTEIKNSEQHGWLVASLVTASTLFIGYFWLNGTKDLAYTVYYYLRRRKLHTIPAQHLWQQKYGRVARAKVLMVYCACNDFAPESLSKSMKQDYPNKQVVILDDSSDPIQKAQIDTFAQEHDILVVRRDNNIGYKAGNLNNYLKDADYDYFVILDSDEIVPEDFISRSLDYFADDEKVGIVQANHIATRNRNKFMSLFSIGVDSHWPTYQMVKHHHGFLSLLGHGAMVSKECYEAAGGFPHFVAEDLCFSIEARNKGYFVSFAPDIMCEEEYPVNYLAFKKRHSKWTQGNMEFIKRYTKRIMQSNMTWYEKLDIVLFTYNLPLTAFFALYIVINVIALPLLGYNISYPVWLIIPTAIFLLAPMLNDIIYYRRTINPFKMAWYLLHSFMLYGSMFFVSLKSSLKSLFGKSVFLVTPKEDTRTTWGEAFSANKGELLFAAVMLAIPLIILNSPLPTLLIVIPAITSVYLSLMANRGKINPDPPKMQTVTWMDPDERPAQLDTARLARQTGR
jgi:cellulose synthase/poly-beta-1,6-N-acetylglucosamine synthase-like glycosyltransferase